MALGGGGTLAPKVEEKKNIHIEILPHLHQVSGSAALIFSMASTSVAPTLVRHSTAAGHWEAHPVPGLTMNSHAEFRGISGDFNWIHLMICNIRLKIHIISIWRCHIPQILVVKN